MIEIVPTAAIRPSRQFEPIRSNSVIRLTDVSKSYGDGPAALHQVSLDIYENELISFVGPSGCGKSTLFRLIAGLSRASKGTMEILREDAAEARKRNEISYVFQDATLLPWSTVSDNVSLPLKLRGVSKKAQKEEAERVLELVGLRDYAGSLPRQLSGGMRMRVSIARALISNPKLLLMDEPFGALDEMTRQLLQNELLDIWRKSPGMTILFVTHNVFEAVFLSTRIAVMTPRPGRITEWFDVDAPYPREGRFRSAADFGCLVDRVSRALAEGSRGRESTTT